MSIFFLIVFVGFLLSPLLIMLWAALDLPIGEDDGYVEEVR